MEMTIGNNRRSRNRRVDRLSSLSDDILIGIITRLPLQLAIATGTLSRRWRGLWTNTTFIDITFREIYNLRNLDYTALKDTMRQITSPFIHRFNIEIVKHINLDFWAPCMDTIIRNVCYRNVHQLKVTWCTPFSRDINYTFPRVIFQTQSLVSLRLGSKGGSYSYPLNDWKFPEDCDTINLPNLKNLSIDHFCSQLQWIEKLVKACPSLEELSLTCLARQESFSWSSRSFNNNLKCSNQKLRQLFINVSLVESCTIVINAPNLEYLAISFPNFMTFSFEEEPVMLHETKIEFAGFDCYLPQARSDLCKFYEAICNVRFLTLDISAVDGLSTVFHNVTRLIFNMKLSHSLNTLLSVLEMCPVVEVLTLKYWGLDDYNGWPFHQKPGVVRTTSPLALRRIKSINVEIDNWRADCKPAKSFLHLIKNLLRSACDLEHFSVSVNDFQDWLSSANLLRNQEHELTLCKKLYRWPTISNCDVEFKGRFLKMS